MSSSIGKLSREEFRRQKDLDAARKAGTAPAELDEEGNAINPHIPQFMAQAPWYMDTGKPSLKHQRKPEDTKDHVKFGDWYQRGQRESKSANKYRKGACENCGAISHKTKDCLERPRKKGAKWTNKNIAADEIFSDVKGIDNDYEAKRDRWNGYDPNEHKHVIKEYEAIEEARRKKREEEIDKQTSTDLSTAKKLARKEKKESGPTSDGDFGSSDSDEEDEDKYAEKADMVGQKVDTDKRISVRNLRIREDRAKYLYNLNPESAYYDPKTRSMREAPNPGVRPEDAQYAGDNFERSRGDVADMQKLQMFAWQAEARGNDIHMQANPTVNELQHREYQQKKEKLNKEIKNSILDKYGGAEHFDSVPKELLTGQSESYVEYTPTGQPVHRAQRIIGANPQRENSAEKSGVKKQDAKSEEKKAELFDGNHANPYGSWADPATGKIGYECCHSTIKNSYCTGQAGKEAANASNILAISAPSKEASGSTERARDQEASSSSKRRSRRSRSRSASFSSDYSSDSYYSSDDSRDKRSRHDHKRHRRHAKGYSSKKDFGEGDVSQRLDKGKLRDALKHEEHRLKENADDKETQKPDWLLEAEAINSRNKDKYRSLRGGQDTDQDVTEEQLEAYRMKNRNRTEDPMANYRDEEEG